MEFDWSPNEYDTNLPYSVSDWVFSKLSFRLEIIRPDHVHSSIIILLSFLSPISFLLSKYSHLSFSSLFHPTHLIFSRLLCSILSHQVYLRGSRDLLRRNCLCSAPGVSHPHCPSATRPDSGRDRVTTESDGMQFRQKIEQGVVGQIERRTRNC